MLHQLKPGLLAVAVALAALAAPAQAAQQSDGGQGASAAAPVQEHHAGKLVFVELLTPDLPAAERFYAAMFGWTFKDMQTGSGAYATAWLDGQQVGAMLQRALPAGSGSRPG